MDKLAQKANEQILAWAKGKSKLTIAIDGYTGVGKTTLLENLVKLNPDILPVHQDDFLIPAEVFIPGNNNYAAIEKLVTAFRQDNGIYQTKIFNPHSGQVDTPISYDLTKKILIIDGVFMFDPAKLNHLWDKRIYLDGNVEEIDQRRVAREKARWGDKYFPETHPDSHFRQVTTALKKYREQYQPEQMADLVLKVFN